MALGITTSLKLGIGLITPYISDAVITATQVINHQDFLNVVLRRSLCSNIFVT